MMRLVALIVTAVLAGAGAAAEEAQPPSSQGAVPPSAGNPAALDLPVSLDKIRDALQGPPTEPFRGLDEKPLFRVEVREKQRFDELMANLTLGKEAVPRGGLYAYEQRQSLWSAQQHPEMQPYFPYNQGQLIVILFEKPVRSISCGRTQGNSHSRVQSLCREAELDGNPERIEKHDHRRERRDFQVLQ